MYLSFDGSLVSTRSWNSADEMLEEISGHEAGSIILGGGAEYPDRFYSVSVNLGSEGGPGRFGVGIVSESHGLTPHLLLRPETGELILGFDFEVVWVDVGKKRVSNRIELDTIFRTFLPVRPLGVLLILHEAGVVALDGYDREMWTHDSDIIERYSVEDGELRLSFFKDIRPEVELDVLTGQQLS